MARISYTYRIDDFTDPWTQPETIFHLSTSTHAILTLEPAACTRHFLRFLEQRGTAQS